MNDIAAQLETTHLTTTSEKHIFLDKIIFNHLIHETIFLYLTPLEFIRLAKTCRSAYATVNSFIHRTFNINHLLSRYFPDPLAFRALQSRTGTLISGSTALQFFDRTFYPESDLDLYLPPTSDKQVLQWLTLHGYQFVPSGKQPRDLDKAISHSRDIDDDDWSDYDTPEKKVVQAVYTFIKAAPAGEDVELKIQCIVARNTPMEAILSFHSTCVMNVISYEMAYCLYPRATLHEHHTLVSGEEASPTRPAALLKYSGRGFEIMVVDRGRLPAGSLFAEDMRYMGDSQCWTVTLDTVGIQAFSWPISGQPLLSCDPVSATSWHQKIGISVIYMSYRVSKFYKTSFHYLVALSVYYALSRHQESLSEGDQEFIDCCLFYNSTHRERLPPRAHPSQAPGFI